MPSFLLLLLCFLPLSLPTPISSHTNLLLTRNPHSLNKQQHTDTNSPIPTSKPPRNKKPISQFPKPNNKTKSLKPKPTNSTSPTTISIIKFKLNKTTTATNKNTTKSNSTKTGQLKSLNPAPKIQKNPKLKPQASSANWQDEADITAETDNDDLFSDFHSTFVPDLEKLSTTSKLYLSKTHREIAASVKPFVGNKYAPSIASAASSSLLLLPLLLLTVLFRVLLRTASLHRALLFAQVYLAIYFATLSLTAVVTGFEPLLFFYAASPGAYAWTQAIQSFGYLVYLVAQLIVLVVAFSADEGERKAGKVVGLAQMLLGLAVGMHYYITVFHRAVSGEAPRANWKVHGIYALCFFVISGLSRAERRKKAYLHGEGADDGKKS